MSDGGRFSKLTWLDGGVVFDRSTGDTHAFDSFTYALFVVQLDEAFAEELWLASVSVKFPEFSRDEIESRYEVAVDHLRKLGFVKVKVN